MSYLQSVHSLERTICIFLAAVMLNNLKKRNIKRIKNDYLFARENKIFFIMTCIQSLWRMISSFMELSVRKMNKFSSSFVKKSQISSEQIRTELKEGGSN